jgi:hypothetical protein
MNVRLTEALGLLSIARQYVTDGEGFVLRQKAKVTRLERRGLDVSDALVYLETLEGMQAEYVDHMEKLERQVLMLVKPQD